MFTKLGRRFRPRRREAVEVDWMPKLKQYSNLFVDLSTSDTKEPLARLEERVGYGQRQINRRRH